MGDAKRLHDLGSLYNLDPTFDVSSRGEVVWTQYEEGDRELWIMEFAD